MKLDATSLTNKVFLELEKKYILKFWGQCGQSHFFKNSKKNLKKLGPRKIRAGLQVAIALSFYKPFLILYQFSYDAMAVCEEWYYKKFGEQFFQFFFLISVSIIFFFVFRIIFNSIKFYEFINCLLKQNQKLKLFLKSWILIQF